ncbi:MAG: hypothetical protein LBV60_01455, partial [Streptomyces sp.]|nr:hypothetical protein [Streptomyces sp.]
PTPYPNAATTVGVTPTQGSGLGLSPGESVDPTGASGSPGGVGTGPITTPSQAAGGYGPISNQIYWVSGGEPQPVPSINNPTADSLTNTATTASTSG